MSEPGPRNLITDVPGLLVGQAEDEAGITGTTVVLCEAPAVAAVDVRGGAPGTRETELLDPAALVSRIDAIVLSGGSAFGLDCGGRVMEAFAAMRRGFLFAMYWCRSSRQRSSSILPLRGAGSGRGSHPTAGSGARRWRAPGRIFALGNAGAGLGAKAGRLKGGIGSASLRLGPGAGARWSARSSRSTAGAAWCGRIAGACGPPIWRSRRDRASAAAAGWAARP